MKTIKKTKSMISRYKGIILSNCRRSKNCMDLPSIMTFVVSAGKTKNGCRLKRKLEGINCKLGDIEPSTIEAFSIVCFN